MIQAMRLLVHPYGNWKAQAYAKLGYATLLFIFRKAAAMGLYPTLLAGTAAAADASSRTPSANNFLAVFVYAMFPLPHLPFPLPTRCSPLFPATQAAAAADSMTSALTRLSAQLLLAVLEWHAIGITSMRGMAC